jgi:hypothetical protein
VFKKIQRGTKPCREKKKRNSKSRFEKEKKKKPEKNRVEKAKKRESLAEKAKNSKKESQRDYVLCLQRKSENPLKHRDSQKPDNHKTESI